MPPQLHELQRGTHVNIILKTDQRTKRLTSGRIAEFLTRGDHPRGVKVRLLDGQIGRVQSVSGIQASVTQNLSSTFPISQPRSGSPRGRIGKGGWSELEPVDNGAAASQDSDRLMSLADYIKPTKSQNPSVQQTSLSAQEELERTFPDIDSSLIAAILVDYPKPHDAKGVLLSLSET